MKAGMYTAKRVKMMAGAGFECQYCVCPVYDNSEVEPTGANAYTRIVVLVAIQIQTGC